MAKIECSRKCDYKNNGFCTKKAIRISSDGCESWKNKLMVTWDGPLEFEKDDRYYYIKSMEILEPDLEAFRRIFTEYEGLGSASGFCVSKDDIGFDEIQGTFFVFIDEVEFRRGHFVLRFRDGKWLSTKINFDTILRGNPIINGQIHMEIINPSLYKSGKLVYLKNKLPFPLKYVFYGFEKEADIPPQVVLLDKDAGTPKGDAKLRQSFEDYADKYFK